MFDQHDRDVDLVVRALAKQALLRRDQRSAFEQMYRALQESPDRVLSVKQRRWVESVVDHHRDDAVPSLKRLIEDLERVAVKP